MQATFPENDYPCPEPLRGEYRDFVERGLERMRTRSAVICGLARDVREALPSTTACIERFGSMFGQSSVILYENDSEDGTLEYLRTWEASRPNVTILSEKLERARWKSIRDPDRASDMADYRNRYLDAALERHGEHDFLIVLDTDLPGGFSFEGVAHTFGCDDWDMMGSNGMQRRTLPDGREFVVHFDAWAFRDVDHAHPHAYGEIGPRRYVRGEGRVRVWSCFGGLGIYRMEALRSGTRYAGGDCEHVGLHFGMRERGYDRIYLNPSQIVVYPTLAVTEPPSHDLPLSNPASPDGDAVESASRPPR